MGMKENWDTFIRLAHAKANTHGKVSAYWDTIHNVLGLALIVLSAATTLFSLVPVHHYIPAALGATATLVSAVTGFLAPSDRRQLQMESSKGFRALSLRMVRCETERVYEDLWREFNKELIAEPFIPKKFKIQESRVKSFTMSPELTEVIAEKEKKLGGKETITCYLDNMPEQPSLPVGCAFAPCCARRNTPCLEQPDAKQPYAKQPDAKQPDAKQPDAKQPDESADDKKPKILENCQDTEASDEQEEP